MPIKELPPVDLFTALTGRAEDFPKDPLAKAIIAESHGGIEIWRREIKHLYEMLTAPVTQPTPAKSNKIDLERTLKGRIDALEGHLKAEKLTAQIAQVHAERTGPAAIAEGLIGVVAEAADAAKKAKGEPDAIAQGLAEKTKAALDAWTKDHSRTIASGHKIFGPEDVASIRKCWVHLDNAFDLLRVVLRRAGQLNDPLLALLPTTRSALRPSMPSGKTSARKRTKKNGKSSGGATDGGTTPPATPGTPPPSTPA